MPDSDKPNRPSLRETQSWMLRQIHPGMCEENNGAKIELNKQANTEGVERLEVYTGGFYARVLEALKEVYAAVYHILGDRQFKLLAEGYTERLRPRGYDLSRVTEQFPEFVKSQAISEELLFLEDLARFERLIDVAFHAVLNAAVDLTPLQERSLDVWEHTQLRFQPALGVLASGWPIVDLWRARLTDRNRIDIDLVNRPQNALVYRHEYQVRCELIDEPQCDVLGRLKAGDTLGEVMRGLSERYPGKDFPIADWFAAWVRLGLITGYRLTTAS